MLSEGTLVALEGIGLGLLRGDEVIVVSLQLHYGLVLTGHDMSTEMLEGSEASVVHQCLILAQ